MARSLLAALPISSSTGRMPRPRAAASSLTTGQTGEEVAGRASRRGFPCTIARTRDSKGVDWRHIRPHISHTQAAVKCHVCVTDFARASCGFKLMGRARSRPHPLQSPFSGACLSVCLTALTGAQSFRQSFPSSPPLPLPPLPPLSSSPTSSYPPLHSLFSSLPLPSSPVCSLSNGQERSSLSPAASPVSSSTATAAITAQRA